jgi:hypothetical protein
VDDRAGLRVLEGDCVSGDQELNKERKALELRAIGARARGDFAAEREALDGLILLERAEASACVPADSLEAS